MTSVGKRICDRRKELGLTQQELADRLGYKSKASINKIEVGKNNLPQKKIVEIARALNTSPAYLMGWISEEADKENAALARAVKAAVDKTSVNKLRNTVDLLTGKTPRDEEVAEFAEMFAELTPEQRNSVKQFMSFLKRGDK